MSSASEAVTEYRAAIAAFLGVPADRVGLFWKGRVALYAILKALGVGSGDEVILPAFTCVVVPNAVLYLGAKPVYADIDPATYTVDPASVSDHLTSRTRVILAQNTFGLAPDLDALTAVAQQSRVALVEDCAHGFGGTYRSRPNGTIADASFFSSQWSKPFSTGIGGFSAVRSAALSARVGEIERRLQRPEIRETLTLRALVLARRKLLGRTGYWRGLRLYRKLSKHNIVIGSSRGEELEGTTMPTGYAKALSTMQAREGLAQLRLFGATLDHQHRIAGLYLDGLRDLDIQLPVQPTYATHTFLRFPVLARDRASVMARAVERDVRLGDWFVSPLHPLEEDLRKWGYSCGSNPVAERVSRHVVNLPTQMDIDDSAAARIIRFVREHRRDFEGAG